MSICKMATLVLSPCVKVRSSSSMLVIYQNVVMKQTTNHSTRRILQTCNARRTFSATTNRSRKQEDSYEKARLRETECPKELKALSQKLRSWVFDVNSFSKLVVQTRFDTLVKPVSPLEYPAADKAFVSLTLKSNNEINDSIFERVTDSLEATANYRDDQLCVKGCLKNDVEAELREQGVSILWHAEVPISFDADIQTSGHGSVVLDRLENLNCTVKSEYGNCHINKIKSGNVKVSSLYGDVISNKVLQGNAEITTQGSGSITTDRLQGQTFVLTSEAGPISCKDIYAVEAGLKSKSARVEVSNMHGECKVATSEGNVEIGSLDGSLKASTDTGNINAYLVQHKEANLKSQNGDISIKVPSDVRTKVHLQASSVTVTPELHTQSVHESQSSGNVVFNGEWNDAVDSTLQASTKHGSIKVAVQSWFDSLKLNK